MKKWIISALLVTSPVWARAESNVKPGQEVKSAAGIEKVIAVSSNNGDTFWVSTFIRDGNCPDNSGKCASDVVKLRAPGGIESIPLSDATGSAAYFSQTKKPVAAVILPSNKGGYAYASAEVFIFSADLKPVSVLKTAEVLLNNLDGAACQGRKLCADSKLTAVFLASQTSEYPDVQFRQSGTTLNQTGNGLEKVERTFSFSFDASTKRYIAKR